MKILVDYTPSKKCINPQVYYTCYKCNACGRFDKKTMWQDRYEMYTDLIKDEVEKIGKDDYKTEGQQTNILFDIVWFANKAKTCVKHIRWKEDEK